MAMDIGEAVVTALGVKGEAFVIEAHEVEHGGLHIVDVNGIFHDIEAELIGGTDCLTAFDTAACHPDGEGLRVVIAPESTT